MKSLICTVCKLEKSVSEFYKSTHNKKGYFSECKSCNLKRCRRRNTKSHLRKRYLKNRKKLLKRQKKYSSKNKEKIKVRSRKYYDNHPDRWMNAGWKQKGIRTESGEFFKVEDYKRELNKCNNRCKICDRSSSHKNKRLSVDHNHKTNLYRGILCGFCNTALTYFQEDPKILNKAIEYLKPKKFGS